MDKVNPKVIYGMLGAIILLLGWLAVSRMGTSDGLGKPTTMHQAVPPSPSSAGTGYATGTVPPPGAIPPPGGYATGGVPPPGTIPPPGR